MTKLLQQALDAYCQAWVYSFEAENPFGQVVITDELKVHILAGLKAAFEQALAQQEQPAQEASATWTEMVVANLVREGVNKHRARELAAHFLTLPTQPAQEPCGCREGECETKKDKSCRMTLEIAERDGIPEWTQEQPASVDAYVGAREDTAIWKKRALEAEALNRKFIAELNGPTYLGEPAQQEQPAQEPVAWLHGTTFQVVVSKNRPNSLAAWLPLFAHPAPTQPALSDDEIWQFWCNRPEVPEGEDDSMEAEFVAACKRAIEAHCRGGANG